MTRVCKECGKEFQSKYGGQVYCPGPHHTECKICGRDIEYKCSPNEKPNYCSSECRKEGKKRTVIAKYGVDNVSRIDEVKKKISAANSSEKVRQKREKTCIEKYGTYNPSKNADIKVKLSKVMKTDRYLEGRKKTCLAKYGFETPMRCREVLKKRRESNIAKYGRPTKPWNEDMYANILSNGNNAHNYVQFKSDPELYITSHFDHKPNIYELCKELGCTDTSVYGILHENNLSYLLGHSSSIVESEVIDFLKYIKPDIKLVCNTRKVIPPYEIDIYLPEYKIGIECNPAFTHNSSLPDPRGVPPKHYKYHQDKSNMCQAKGIFLFHIFGYEWANKKDILKSMLANLLKMNKNVCNGRDTLVCFISHQESKDFLNANHRQGYTSAKIRLGLRNKETNELLSIMTFNNMRKTMGSRNNDNENIWELSRFCSKLNTNVRGGASKLLKYFIKTFNPGCIVSFSDIAHTKGNLYSILGFNLVSISDPGYVWSSIDDKIYHHRVQCQKHNLKNLLKDDTIDISKSTEREIMESHGFVQVYDCGVIRWELKLDED